MTTSFYISNSWLLGEGVHHCMLSYHKHDKPEVMVLNRTLESLGFKTWVDKSRSDGLLSEVSEEGDGTFDPVSKAQVIVICFSEAYKASETCKEEAMRAVLLEKPLILARMEPTCFIDGWLLMALGGAASRHPLIELYHQDGRTQVAVALKDLIEKIIVEKVTNKEESKSQAPSNMEVEVKNKVKDLWMAIQIGDAAKLRKVVQSIPEGHYRTALLETRGDDKWHHDTPLLRAARCGRAEALQALIELGANVAAHNKLGFNALHLAAGYGHDGVLKILLEKDSRAVAIEGRSLDVDSKGQWGRTALLLAASENHPSVVRLLLARGANIEARGGHFERTPLGMAAHFGRNAIIDILCEAGARISATDADGESVLHLAATTGKLETARLLIKKWHADIHAKDFDNWTPLMTAAGEGKQEFVKMLLEEFHANYKVQTIPEGHSVVHIAAEFGRCKVIDTIIEYIRADQGIINYDPVEHIVNMKNNNGDTPLHVACAHGNYNTVETLIKYGANVKERNNHKKTAITLVRDFIGETVAESLIESSNNIIKLLQNYGAPDL